MDNADGVSPSGKARGSGPRIRGFESLHPSHENRQTFWSGVFHSLRRAMRTPNFALAKFDRVRRGE